MINIIGRVYRAVRDKIWEPDLGYQGPSSRAKAPIEHNVVSESVAAEMAETISFDLPLDEHGNVIVGLYESERPPMDGVRQGDPTPSERALTDSLDRLHAQVLMDSTRQEKPE